MHILYRTYKQVYTYCIVYIGRYSYIYENIGLYIQYMYVHKQVYIYIYECIGLYILYIGTYIYIYMNA